VEYPMTVAPHGAVRMGGVACASRSVVGMGGVARTSRGAACVSQSFLACHMYRRFQMDFSVMFGLL